MKRLLRPALALLAALALSGCGGKKDAAQLNLFIWTEYMPDSVLQKFTAQTGIKVNYDTYDSNEALLEKLQSGVADYDLVVPSDYMVRILINEKLVQALDKSKIPNLKNLDARLLNQKFDPDNTHSLPYFWGTTGLGYNKQNLKEPVDSWAVLFDEKNAGKILMLDDVRECFTVCLKLAGKSLNEKDPAVLKEMAAKLKAQKKLVKTYNSGDFANILASGDVDLAHGYNGQIAKAVHENPDKLAYVMPKEGGTVWMDNVCIPAKAKHADAAYAFLNFILQPEIGAEIVNAMSYASANEAAKKFIKPEILNDLAIYPNDDILKRCEFIEDVGDTMTLLDQLWTEIKAQ